MKNLEYQMKIAEALKRELGGSHQAIKTAMRWTGASERTAKNWIAGAHGPAGHHLVELLRHSDEVLKMVLSASGRTETRAALALVSTQDALDDLVAALDVVLNLEGGGK